MHLLGALKTRCYECLYDLMAAKGWLHLFDALKIHCYYDTTWLTLYQKSCTYPMHSKSIATLADDLDCPVKKVAPTRCTQNPLLRGRRPRAVPPPKLHLLGALKTRCYPLNR